MVTGEQEVVDRGQDVGVELGAELAREGAEGAEGARGRFGWDWVHGR